MKYTTVIFDMDGVVIDSQVLFDNADTEFFRMHGKIYNREKVALFLAGMHLKEGTALLKEKYGLPGLVENLTQQRQELLEKQYRTNLQYIPGFEAFHQKVVHRRLQTCIATSSIDGLLKLAIETVGLSEKFGNNIFKISDVGNKSKPDPTIYLYAARRMGSAPEQCMVIEDAPKGIQAAKNANMFCIGITTTFDKDHLRLADTIVDSYDEIDLEKL